MAPKSSLTGKHTPTSPGNNRNPYLLVWYLIRHWALDEGQVIDSVTA